MSTNPAATSEDAIAEYIKKKYRAQHEAAQSVHQGLSAYLKEPPVRGRVNQRFLSHTLQAVAFENRQATKREREPSEQHRRQVNQHSQSPSRSSPHRNHHRHQRHPHQSRSSREPSREASRSRSPSPARQAPKQRHQSHQRSYSRSPAESPVRRNRSPVSRTHRHQPRFRENSASRSRSLSHGSIDEPRDPQKRHRRVHFSKDVDSPRSRDPADAACHTEPRDRLGDRHLGGNSRDCVHASPSVHVKHASAHRPHSDSGHERESHYKRAQDGSNRRAQESDSFQAVVGGRSDRGRKSSAHHRHSSLTSQSFSSSDGNDKDDARRDTSIPSKVRKGAAHSHEVNVQDEVEAPRVKQLSKAQHSTDGSRVVDPGKGNPEEWEFDEDLQRSLQKVPRRGRGAVGSRVFDTGPYQEDDATHATHASRSSAHQLLLPAAGSDGRPIGVGLRAAAGVRRHTGGGASTSSGKGVVNDRVVQLAKQLTDSGVPLELATARAEIQVLTERKAEGKEGKEKKKKKKSKKEKKSRDIKHKR